MANRAVGEVQIIEEGEELRIEVGQTSLTYSSDAAVLRFGRIGLALELSTEDLGELKGLIYAERKDLLSGPERADG